MRKSKSFYPFLFSLALLILSACGQGTSTPPPVTEVSNSLSAIPSTNPTSAAVEPVDIIFYNGTLLTMETDMPQAQALAVRGNLIAAVGSDDEVLGLQGQQTVMVDLQGQTLMPGFVDGHTHLLTFYDRRGSSFEEAQQIALAHGYTTVSEMWANEDVVSLFLDAETRGTLRLRVNVFPAYNNGSPGSPYDVVLYKTWYPAHDPILDPEKMLRIPGIKIFVDGDNANAERGCWALSEPFEPNADVIQRGTCGTPSGDLYWEQEELNQVVKAAQDAGYRVAFHAMGDRAIETAINAIEYALGGESNETYRHQIEHNSLARPDLLVRYQSLGVAATVRGNAEVCHLSDFESAFGTERSTWYINRYELPSLGIHALMETDFGWTIDPNLRFDQRTLDPFAHLYGFVTHRYATSGNDYCEPDALAAEKVISMQRALEMITTEAAWAVSMEDHIGSLKAGKFADLVVLSGNPLTVDPQDLLTMNVLMTMVNGKQEYCSEGHEVVCPETQAEAPRVQDLPTWGNLALYQQVTASNNAQYPAKNAVDGNENTSWGAGDYAPQWIEVDLGAPARVSEIRLMVQQDPSGLTFHNILVKGETGEYVKVGEINQVTNSQEWLLFRPATLLEGVRYVKVETTESPSWVAWVEIRVNGTR